MDKIYSRKRLLIPKLRISKRTSKGLGNVLHGKGCRGRDKQDSFGIGNNNGNNINQINNKLFNTKTLKTAIVVIIAVFMANKIISAIEPTMDVMCIDMAKSIATKVSNEQATVVMRKIWL